jgi:PAS domain-containing protein
VTNRFERQLLLHGAPLVGRELFEVIAFDDPARIGALLVTEGGGEEPFCRYRIGEEERVAAVRVEPFEHDGIRYAQLVVIDWNELAYLGAAADASAEPLLVVGGDGRLRYANRAASTLFGEIYPGREAAPLLDGAAEHGFATDSAAVSLPGGESASLVRLKRNRGGS